MPNYKNLLIITILILIAGGTFYFSKSFEQHSISYCTKKIVAYAQNQTKPTPTIQDYKDANISNITSHNIDDINRKIVQIETDEGDITYKYDPTKDYDYTFGNSKVQTILKQLEHNSIHLSQNNFDQNMTVLLKLNVSTDRLGKYFVPQITTVYQGKNYTHTLESGVNGMRYLNLSALNIKPNTTIKFKTHHVILKDQKVAFMLFKNPDISNKKILIIAPHPDDAEIAAFGLYSEHPEQTYVITITAGDAGPTDVYTDVFSSTQEQFNYKGKRRTIDSITVPLLGSVPPVHSLNLGYFDSSLYAMKHNKSESIQSTTVPKNSILSYRQYNVSPLIKGLDTNSSWTSLVNNLVTLLDKIQPDIIILPHPKLDRHIDHKLSTEALFEALKKSKIRTGKLLLYTNHATRSEYYPYGSKGEAITLPPEFTGTVYFNSIFSYPLSIETQKNKMFALEAMSDLRYGTTKKIFLDPCKNKPIIVCKDYSYVRRSIRNNELFFVIDIESIFK